jgi:hypothetical protein
VEHEDLRVLLLGIDVSHPTGLPTDGGGGS